MAVRHHFFLPHLDGVTRLLFPVWHDACVEDSLTCSAKGCAAPAVWGVLWNNPKLHTPERRKAWLACDDHRESLSDFLAARNFLRDVVPVEELPPDS